MANVVVHAYRDRPGVFELHATYFAGFQQVTVTVTDYGRWQHFRAGPTHWRAAEFRRTSPLVLSNRAAVMATSHTRSIPRAEGRDLSTDGRLRTSYAGDCWTWCCLCR
jgi:hypothetical protein